MKFTLEFDCSGTCFEGARREGETARVLSKAATQVRLGYELAPITDFNGDTIGEWSIA